MKDDSVTYLNDRPHRLFTTYEDDVQHTTCLDCGAHTEGPVLPEMPCPGPQAATP